MTLSRTAPRAAAYSCTTFHRLAAGGLALLCVLAAPLAAASARAATAVPAALAMRERIVLIGVPVDGNCGCGPYDLGDFDLSERGGQPRGTLNVFGIPTSPPSVPDDQASGIFTFVATFDDGTIVGQGRFPLDNGPTIAPIVGGTGRYRRTRGYARFAPRDDGSVRIVLHLLR
ncbi:dirigent protein [Candidatus Binatia bacterium]|nr:dirigent protein [Candidatus Binatia bacterium]